MPSWHGEVFKGLFVNIAIVNVQQRTVENQTPKHGKIRCYHPRNCHTAVQEEKFWWVQ